MERPLGGQTENTWRLNGDYPGAAGYAGGRNTRPPFFLATSDRRTGTAQAVWAAWGGVSKPQLWMFALSVVRREVRAPTRGETGDLIEPQTVREVIRRVVRVAEPDRIILFGSVVRGEGREDSDFDLLVIKSGVVRKREVARRIYRELVGVGVPVDIVVVTPEEIEEYRGNVGTIIQPAMEEGRDMSPKRDPTDPREWLRRARSNLARAKLLARGSVHREKRSWHGNVSQEPKCTRRGREQSRPPVADGRPEHMVDLQVAAAT